MRTGLDKGIEESSIPDRVAAFGTNEPPMAKIKGCCILFFEALNDLMLIVLMIAGVVSTLINYFTEEDHKEVGKSSRLTP